MITRIPKLSFCIPIYNFGTFVGATLESVIAEIEDHSEIEIIVLDGGSTDNTSEVMHAYCMRYPQIRYIKQKFRGGIDIDLDKTIKESRGEYCWLLSGDDTIKSGSIKKLLQWLQEKHDVYICEHTQCDINLNFLYVYPIFSIRVPIRCEMSNKDERHNYLKSAINTEAIFSFMSGLIIKRSMWIATRSPDDFIGSCWGHVARIFQHGQHKLKVCFVAESWVNRRGDNDSFLQHGYIRRLGIAIDGYHRMAEHYFGVDSIEAHEIRRLVRADFKFIFFLHAKSLAADYPSTENRKELDRLVRLNYCENSLACLFAKWAYFAIPVFVYKIAREIKRFFKQIFSVSIRHNKKVRKHAS